MKHPDLVFVLLGVAGFDFGMWQQSVMAGFWMTCLLMAIYFAQFEKDWP